MRRLQSKGEQRMGKRTSLGPPGPFFLIKFVEGHAISRTGVYCVAGRGFGTLDQAEGYARSHRIDGQGIIEIRRSRRPSRQPAPLAPFGDHLPSARKPANKAAEKRSGNGTAATKAKVAKRVPIRPESKRAAQEFETALEAALLAANPEG
jgi:hypothetical protein